MKRALDRGFNPPAAMVPVRISAPSGLDAIAISGKLDTGADLSAVPEHLVADLDIAPVRTVRAAGFAGAPQEAIVYRVDIEIDGVTLPRVEALGTRRPYVIVGRNVLQHFVLRIDGPRAQLELRAPSSGRRTRKRS